jgi:hypothetical protein
MKQMSPLKLQVTREAGGRYCDRKKNLKAASASSIKMWNVSNSTGIRSLNKVAHKQIDNKLRLQSLKIIYYPDDGGSTYL